MLSIRQEQVTALRDDADRQFQERAIRYLREVVPVYTSARTPAQLHQFIDRQSARARAFGATTEREFVKWFFLAASISETFDELPDVRAFLAIPKFTVAEKLDGLLAVLADSADQHRSRRR